VTAPGPARRTAAGNFALAHAAASHWGVAAKACLNDLAPAVAAGANAGFLFVTEALGEGLSSILTFLRETTRIAHWTGAVVPGLCAGAAEYRSGGALAVMAGRLPEGSFHAFSGLTAASIRAASGAWLGGDTTAIVLGDPRNPAVPQAIEDLVWDVAVMTGGLVSAAGPAAQVADTVVGGGLSGLLLGPEVAVVTGLTQGCTPIGPPHAVFEAWQGVLMGLDGRPALDVLKEEAGELIARDIRRAAEYIHVAFPVEGYDSHDYLVRRLVGVDSRQGWLALSGRVETGDRLMFVRRDPNAARADLVRMLAEVRTRLDGRRPLAGFYFSCVARGAGMFGGDGVESALVAEALGGAPLIGFFANGEIFAGRLYGYSGVLLVLAGGRR
jgi:small ligand-binding sensory domain FIST